MLERKKPIERAIDKIKRSIAFPEAGDGALLRLRFSDLKLLEAKFGHEYMAEADARFDRFETDWLEGLITFGAKGPDGKTAIKVDIDELGLATKDIVIAVKDALYLSTMDMTFTEAKKYIDDQIEAGRQKAADGEEADEPADPPIPEASSSASTDEASAQG